MIKIIRKVYCSRFKPLKYNFYYSYDYYRDFSRKIEILSIDITKNDNGKYYNYVCNKCGNIIISPKEIIPSCNCSKRSAMLMKLSFLCDIKEILYTLDDVL